MQHPDDRDSMLAPVLALGAVLLAAIAMLLVLFTRDTPSALETRYDELALEQAAQDPEFRRSARDPERAHEDEDAVWAQTSIPDGGVPQVFVDRRPRAAERADPQLSRSERAYGGDAGAPPPFFATYRTGRLASVSGLPLSTGASCEVRVLPVDDSSFNCLVRVMCDDVVVYPNPEQTSGFAPCEVDNGSVRTARDDQPTMRDTDPTLTLDLASGRIVVTDQERLGTSGTRPPFRAIVELPPSV